jgi:hypothetical protein
VTIKYKANKISNAKKLMFTSRLEEPALGNSPKILYSVHMSSPVSKNINLPMKFVDYEAHVIFFA